MTCIVAIVQDGIVHMGADACGSNGFVARTRKDPKIFKVGEFIFGFTSSFRMGQILGYKFNPPDHRPDHSIEKYMHTQVIDHIRDIFHLNGYARNHSGEESGGLFLVGIVVDYLRLNQTSKLKNLFNPIMQSGAALKLP